MCVVSTRAAFYGGHGPGVCCRMQAAHSLWLLGYPNRTLANIEATLAEWLATMANSGRRWWEAELYRLRGELLLLQAVAQPEEAEVCFQQALAVARRQQARSWELRAATSLARLWQRQSKRPAAREPLATVYGWFT